MKETKEGSCFRPVEFCRISEFHCSVLVIRHINYLFALIQILENGVNLKGYIFIINFIVFVYIFIVWKVTY